MISLLDWLFTVALVAATWQVNAAVLQRQLHAEAQQPADKRPPDASAPASGSLHERLRRIEQGGGYADLAAFVTGARLAYERIVTAFASCDLEAVSPLLAPAVRDSFAQAIAERRRRGEAITMTFIGLAAAEPVDAGLDDGLAWIEMRFVAQMVSVTTNNEGAVVAGHPRRVDDTSELWTFARKLGSDDPNWTLMATEGDG